MFKNTYPVQLQRLARILNLFVLHPSCSQETKPDFLKARPSQCPYDKAKSVSNKKNKNNVQMLIQGLLNNFSWVHSISSMCIGTHMESSYGF